MKWIRHRTFRWAIENWNLKWRRGKHAEDELVAGALQLKESRKFHSIVVCTRVKPFAKEIHWRAHDKPQTTIAFRIRECSAIDGTWSKQHDNVSKYCERRASERARARVRILILKLCTNKNELLRIVCSLCIFGGSCLPRTANAVHNTDVEPQSQQIQTHTDRDTHAMCVAASATCERVKDVKWTANSQHRVVALA